MWSKTELISDGGGENITSEVKCDSSIKLEIETTDSKGRLSETTPLEECCFKERI